MFQAMGRQAPLTAACTTSVATTNRLSAVTAACPSQHCSNPPPALAARREMFDE
jgi:hypothetical protein